jgi:hypothetical protein
MVADIGEVQGEASRELPLYGEIVGLRGFLSATE